MSLSQRIVDRMNREHRLFSAMIELTYRCNLDCFFCYNDLGLKGRPLSFEQYCQLFRDLAEMGVLYLSLSGGEPVAHPRFVDLGRTAKELGFAVRVKSNGHALRGKLAKRLRYEIDPWKVDISLHGATAEIHDRQTRVPGSFNRLMENIPELLDLGVSLQLNATLTAWNEHQIEDLFGIADRWHLDLRVSPSVSPRDDGDTEPLDIAPSHQALIRCFEFMKTRAEEEAVGAVAGRSELGFEEEVHGPTAGQKNCGAGSSTVTVDPFGNVFPCIQWRRSLGSLHSKPILEIWENSPALGDIREANERVGRKRQALGAAALGLPLCMGRSELETGNPESDYADSLRIRDAWQEAKPLTGKARLQTIY